MKIDLSGKTALVTGSTGGIGLATVNGLAAAGAHVIVNGRGQDRVDAAIAQAGTVAGAGRISGVACDVGTPEGCAALVAAVPAVDILVNNAAIFVPSDFFETEDAAWDSHWAINVMAGVRLSRAYAPGMAERGWGRIIFIGSESAFNIPADMIHYGVSKTADVALARGLAKRLAATGVTVNSVLPGPTLSEGVATFLKADMDESGKSLEEAGADFVKEHRPSSIIRRAASVEEVANMIVYVASPQASATTGAALRVDGGVIDSL